MCRDFASELRPLIFDGVTLKSLSDVNYFRSIIVSGTPPMLAKQIQSIIMERKAIEGLSLLRHLSSALQVMTIVNVFEKSYPTRLRAHLTAFRALRQVTFRRMALPSVSALLRLLGSIHMLEDVTMSSVEWKTTHIEVRAPDCNSDFRHLRSVNCDYVPHAWQLGWAMAAAGLRYTFSRRRNRGDGQDQSMLEDIMTIVRIVRLFWERVVDSESTWSYMKVPTDGMHGYTFEN